MTLPRQDVESGTQGWQCHDACSSWIRRSICPGCNGNIGWVRSSAWIWVFSSTDSTRALSGGFGFWLKVFNDLRNRGAEDVLIAVTDGLKGMSEALGAVCPDTTLQTCIVHLIRNSLNHASWDKRRALAKALKPIYQALNAEAAEQALDEFETGPWSKQYPTVVAAWRRAWDRVIPFFVFPQAIRKVIYTTNAIESINAQLRKIIKTRGHFPNDEAATKLIWLGLRNITANWGKEAHDWKSAMNQFAILYGDRFTRPNW